jgi:hypothetical protein
MKIAQQKKTTLTFTHGGGRLGNQLINFINLLAFHEENKHRLSFVNLSFWLYSELFDVNSICAFNKKSSFFVYKKIYQFLTLFKGNLKEKVHSYIIRLFHLFGMIMPNYQSIVKPGVSILKYTFGKKVDNINLNNELIESIFNKNTVIAGWKIRCWDLVEKHQDHIREVLQVKRSCKEKSNKFVAQLREKYEILIGVHIRQTDFNTTDYYFDTAVYYEFLRKLEQQLSPKKVGFIITSDEEKQKNQFPELNVHFASGIMGGNGHYIDSIQELSLCDFIVMPPSTFGAWSSFISQIPFLLLLKKDQEPCMDDLIMNNFFDIVKNGKIKNLFPV